jgi:hypothetical protein
MPGIMSQIKLDKFVIEVAGIMERDKGMVRITSPLSLTHNSY